MKLIFIVAFFFPVFVFGQLAVSNPGKLESKVVDLDIDSIAPAMNKFPFAKIKVIDARFDTASFGFSYYRLLSTSSKKLKLKGGISASIENYFNNYYSHNFSNNQFELLIVIKKFWLSRLNSWQNVSPKYSSWESQDGSFFLKWEYYFGKDSMFMPLKRIDTILPCPFESVKKIVDNYAKNKARGLPFYLNTMIEAINYNYAISAYEKNAKKTLFQINEFSKKSLTKPLFSNLNNIPIGVYKTYDDLLQLRPSYINYEIKKVKSGNGKVKILMDDKRNPIESYWGYYDGKDLYCDFLSSQKLYRQENVFQFFLDFTMYAPADVSFPNSNKNSFVKYPLKYFIPLQLDMETGLPY